MPTLNLTVNYCPTIQFLRNNNSILNMKSTYADAYSSNEMVPFLNRSLSANFSLQILAFL